MRTALALTLAIAVVRWLRGGRQPGKAAPERKKKPGSNKRRKNEKPDPRTISSAAVNFCETTDPRRLLRPVAFSTGEDFKPVTKFDLLRIGVSTLVAVWLALATGRADAENWNQFRGPHGDGQAGAAALPVHWSETQNVVWKTAIHGKAWSSPVVWGEQIWMTSATEDGTRLFAVCVDAQSGKVTHDLTVFEIAEPMFCYPYNSYASPTPVVEQGRLWVHFGSAGTACVDTSEGRVLWRRQDLPCDHWRGPGSSPIVFRDLLILTFDGYDRQYVAALDKHTGRTLWKTDRSINYETDNGDYKKAYSTPVVFEHRGRLQLVSPAAVGAEAYDPLTGKLLWSVHHGGYNAAARPLYTHGMVIINTQNGLRLLGVRPDGTGDVTDTHVVWSWTRQTPTRPSQLVIGDHLYMVNDQGIVTCLDVRTGAPAWTHRMGGRHSASPIHAGGRIWLFDEDGVSRVIEANPDQFRLVAENPLDAGCMASPAVRDKALIVRTKTHLYRLEQ